MCAAKRGGEACCRTGLAILAAITVTAEAAENDPDFTFRRVAPPSSSAKRLITVQVEVTPPLASGEMLPSDRSSEVTGIEPLGPVSNTSSSLDQDMFWAYLSPTRGPDRLAVAARLVQTLSGSTSVREAVSEASIRDIGIRYGSAVSAATRGKRVSPRSYWRSSWLSRADEVKQSAQQEPQA